MSRRLFRALILCTIPPLAAMPGACSSPAAPPPATRFSTTAQAARLAQNLPPPLTGINEGSFLSNRQGKLLFNPIGPYPHFEFWEKGRLVYVDLLPNRNLMAMEQAAFWNPRLRFRVWGEVTNYNWKSYLLVERVTQAWSASGPATTPTAPTTQP